MFDNKKDQKEYDDEDITFGCTMLILFSIIGFIASIVLTFSYPPASITVAIMSATFLITSILIKINQSIKGVAKT